MLRQLQLGHWHGWERGERQVRKAQLQERAEVGAAATDTLAPAGLAPAAGKVGTMSRAAMVAQRPAVW